MTLLELVAERVGDHGGEPDAFESAQAPREFGVEDARGHESEFSESWEILIGRMQDPFWSVESGGEWCEIRVVDADRVDEEAAGSVASQLDQVGASGVSIAGSSFGV